MRKTIYLLLALTLLAVPAQAATKAQSISFLLSQVRTSTTSLVGGKVWAYAAGGTTPKSIWLDKDKQTLAANPYTLDANATAQLFADGVYRIVIKDSAGVTKFDRDGLSFQDLSGAGIANVLDYGTGTLAEAITAIGSVPKTLAYGTDQTLSANTVIPDTLELLPLNGAVINHGTYTVSYLGSTSRWPVAQIFNGTGAVTGIKDAYAAYWGFSTSATGAVNAAAIQAAIANYGSSYGGKINLHAGTFAVAPDVISTFHRHGITISGASTGYGYVETDSGTRLVFTAGSIGINMFDDDGLGLSGTYGTLSFNNKLENVTIDGNGVLTTGVKLNGNQTLQDMGVTGCKDYGIWLGNFTNSANLFRVTGVANTVGLGYGLHVDGIFTTTYTVKNCNFRINKKGIHVLAGQGVTFNNVVTESNSEEGAYFYRPSSSTPFSNFSFNELWVENNWMGNATGGYSIVIDAASPDYGDGSPGFMHFSNGNITAPTGGKYLRIGAARYADFYDTPMNGGVSDGTGILLDSTWAAFVYFHDGGFIKPPGGWGYRGGYFDKNGVNTTGGYVSNMGMSNSFQRVFGTSGGIVTKVAYATVNVTAASTLTAAVNVPAGAKLLGCQIRVDSALAGVEAWNAAYQTGATQTIATGGVGGTKNAKINTMFDENFQLANTTATTTVAITKNGGGNFTAQGSFSVWVYYQTFEDVSDL